MADKKVLRGFMLLANLDDDLPNYIEIIKWSLLKIKDVFETPDVVSFIKV